MLSLLVFLVLGTIPSVFLKVDNTTPEYGNRDYDLEFNAVSWNVSDYVNFTSPPVEAGHITKMFRIFIDDNDPSRNWSVYTSNYSWCTGLGTEIDPYIIENLYIYGNGSAGMIFIKNSDKYFIIRNCWFNYSGPNEYDVGVLLQFSSNGMIVNNSFTYTHGGVTLEHLTSNVTVDNNIFISDHTTAGLSIGLTVGGCNSIVISSNKFRDHYQTMGFYNSINATLKNNYFENTIWTVPTVMSFNNLNDSEIILNVFAGSLALASTFSVLDIGGQGNTIINNTVGAGDPWVFGPETAKVFLSTPQLSQVEEQIWLIDSFNNLVAHNVLHGFIGGGNDGTIHGFDIFILMGMFGVISILILVVKRKRH